MLNDNNITVPNSYITAGYYSISSGYEAAGKILTESEELPTAVFAGNDYMAFGAIKRFCETGFKVPDDISVAGIDDIEISGNYNPPLTTMHADQVLAGEKAAEMLFKYISSENSGYEVLSLGMELIERKSVLRLV